MSSVKAYMETQRRFMVAGDSGYPISEVLMKPFPIAEAAQCPRKRLFNRRISGLRTVMSENIRSLEKKISHHESYEDRPGAQPENNHCYCCPVQSGKIMEG